jgi:hypothetical protein
MYFCTLMMRLGIYSRPMSLSICSISCLQPFPKMMFKARQGLTFQKNSGIVIRSLQGHQVLNLMEGQHPLDSILWAYILEDSKLSEVLGGWVVWIHRELQLDPFRLACMSPINLFYLLHLRKKE